VTFQWIDPKPHNDDSGTQRGFIAQDVERVFPNWVNDKGYTGPDGEFYRTLDLKQIEALEVESIRELKTENDKLTAQLNDLTKRMKTMEDAHRPPVAMSMSTDGVGTCIGGLAIGAAILLGRRKREQTS
jgi:hypothetical protein